MMQFRNYPLNLLSVYMRTGRQCRGARGIPGSFVSTKTMRRFVQMEAEVPDEVSQWGFRDVLRHVADRGLIDDVQVWFDYRTMRGETGLAYMPEKARAVCDSARTLLRDARALLAQLELRAG